MRIRGLDHKHVDHLVEKFDVAMRQSMQHVLTTGLTAAVENSPEPYIVISGIQAAWVQQLETELEPMLGEIFITAANGVAGQLGKFPVKIPTGDYAQHVLQTSLSHVQDFSSDIWETATQQVTLGLQDGDSIAQIASRIEDVAEIKAKKAKVVAQTAVIGAVNGGEWAQMMHSASTFDLVMTKEWIATHDTHVRPTHAAADGQTVPLTEKFSIGDAFLDYPGDPAGPPSEIVSCRCTTGYDVDVEDQSESVQSSLGLGSTSAPVATVSLTAAFNEAEHPRGKDGKFITAGIGFPGAVLHALKILKDSHKGDDFSWDDLSSDEKSSFIDYVPSISPKAWSNLKDEDKEHIHDAASSGLNEGVHGSANAVTHLEELDDKVGDNVINLTEDEDVFNPDTSIPTGAGDDEQALDLKKQVHELLQDGKMSEDEAHALYDWVDKGHYDVTQTYIKTLDKSRKSVPSPSLAPLTKISGKTGGVNQSGGVYESEDGHQFYVKGHNDLKHAKAEVISSKLYTAAGVDVAEQNLADSSLVDDVPNATIAEKVDGVLEKTNYSHEDPTGFWQDPTFIKAVQKGWAIDVWLGNNDAVGQNYDNILNKNGKPVRVDMGVGLGFDEEGKPKSSLFDHDVSQLDQLTSWSPSNDVVYGGMTSKDKMNSAKLLQSMTDEKIDKIVSENDGDSALAKMLKTRRDTILDAVMSDEDVFNPDTSLPTEPSGGTLIKMTHGLIHAKHSPGEIIGEAIHPVSGNKLSVTWNSSEYEVILSKNGSVVGKTNVKKSKLYAYLANAIPNADWKSAGATSATPAVKPIVTLKKSTMPLFPGNSLLDDKLDEAFGHVPTLKPTGSKPLTPANASQSLDMTGWKQVGDNPGGFNTGGFFESPSGEKYYVKSISNPDAAKSEILSAQLYKAAGVDTAEVRHVGAGAPPGWSNVIASKVVEGESAAKLMSSKSHNDFKDKIAEGFAVDAWLANWDTVGSGDTKYSNILNVDGKPVHIDVGGSLQVGGTGQKKHGKFTSANVVELDTLKDPAFNKETANVFGAMTPEQEKNSAKKLMGVTDAQIDQLVSDSGLDPKIAKMLKERRDFILDKYGLKDGSSNPVVEMMTDVDMPDDSPVVEMWTDVIDTSVPSSPSVASTTSAFPTEGIAHVLSYDRTFFYNNFKNEKVSPAWSGAKIFNSLQVAKSKSSSPEVQSLTIKQMLELVDQQHQVKTAGKIGATPYADKVRAWLKTPNGKKAALTAKSGGAPAPLSTGYAKKAAKAAATKIPTGTISPAEALGVDHTPNIHSTAKIDIYNQFKTAPTGKYLTSSPPADLFYNAFQQSSNAFGGSEVVSPLDVLKIVDSETSAKVGVTNNHLFEKKVTDWLNTPTGKKTAYQIVNEDFNPAAAKAAKKIASGVTGVSSGTIVPKNTPHTQKIQSVAQTVPSFDPSLGKSDFPVTSTSAASSLWNSMTTADNGGPLKTNQKAALKSYTGSGFSSMNNFLRGKSDASDTTANKVKLAQAGMRPSTENIVLHRGAQFFKDWQSYDEIKAKEGQVWHEPAFFSASVGGTSAFHGSIKYEIQVPKGTPMAWVAGFSQFKGEREMLLAAGLKYQIVSVTKKPGSYTTDVVMRVVPDDTEAVNVVASGG